MDVDLLRSRVTDELLSLERLTVELRTRCAQRRRQAGASIAPQFVAIEGELAGLEARFDESRQVLGALARGAWVRR